MSPCPCVLFKDVQLEKTRHRSTGLNQVHVSSGSDMKVMETGGFQAHVTWGSRRHCRAAQRGEHPFPRVLRLTVYQWLPLVVTSGSTTLVLPAPVMSLRLLTSPQPGS